MLWKCWGWLNMKFQAEWKWGLRLSKMPFQAEWKCSLRLSENEIWGQPTWGNWCLVACSYPVGRQAGVMKGRDDGCQDNGCIHKLWSSCRPFDSLGCGQRSILCLNENHFAFCRLSYPVIPEKTFLEIHVIILTGVFWTNISCTTIIASQ